MVAKSVSIQKFCHLPSYQLSPSISVHLSTSYLLHEQGNMRCSIPISSLLQSPLENPSFRFLDQPPELRDAVYGMILPNVVHINSAFDIKDLALLCSSRQLRQESGSIFYRKCTFYVKLKHNTLFGASEHWDRFQR